MHGQHLRPPRSAYCAPWANDNDDVAHRKLDAAVPSHRAPSLARGYSHVGDADGRGVTLPSASPSSAAGGGTPSPTATAKRLPPHVVATTPRLVEKDCNGGSHLCGFIFDRFPGRADSARRGLDRVGGWHQERSRLDASLGTFGSTRVLGVRRRHAPRFFAAGREGP